MSLTEPIESANKKNVINNEAVNVVSNSRPENYDYFTDEDADVAARQNPEYASRLKDPEFVQAIRDVRSRKNLRLAKEYN
ncbi:MAG: hypothetical protein OXH90_09030 [Paracoccaceae bacterium]|nr:hypothetical protein [Paracoccaceae bacterium]MDE2918204.1 hypothetical protein [Paracoccaceae bacterium]